MGSIFHRHPSSPHTPLEMPRIRRDSTVDAQSGIEADTPLIKGPWLIVIIVIGSLIVATLIAYLVVHQIRLRRTTKQVLTQADPINHQRYYHRRKLSQEDRQKQEELERAIMIRKSLASRTSLVSARSSLVSPLSADFPLDDLAREEENLGLKVDWKEWEARIQRERSASGSGGHLDASLRDHPALSARLAIPEPSRSPSPVRGIIQPRRGGTPPPQLIIVGS